MKTMSRCCWRVACAFLITLCLLLFSSFYGTARAATTPIKIMPLGDSLTYGTNSSNGGGYRLPLWNDLVSQGANVDFVGSQQSGPENFDADNEGHPGWRIDQISANIVNWLTTYQPHIILLHIGTNDIIQNDDVADAPTRLSNLISQITSTLPNATLFVAQIIPLNSDQNSEVINYNNAIPAIVQAAGPNVHMVDMYDAVSANLLPDNIHPNDYGYGLMANVWHTALLPLLGLSGQSHQFSTDFENGSPQPTSMDVVDGGGYPDGGVTNVGGICCGLSGPESGTRIEGTSRSGTTALLYSGDASNSSAPDFAYMVGFDLSGLDLSVDASSTLSYWVYPQSAANGLASGSNSTCVSVDLIFSDGSNLRDSGAVDQYGNRAHPAYQCNHLTLDTWQQVTVNLGAYVSGKTILRLDVGYDQPNSTGGYRGYLDDISIAG